MASVHATALTGGLGAVTATITLGSKTVHATSMTATALATFDVAGTASSGVTATVTGPGEYIVLFDGSKNKIRNLSGARGIDWRHEMSGCGAVSFELLVDDASDVIAKRYVKVYRYGKARMVARIGDSSTDYTSEGRTWRRWDALLGGLDMLNDGTVDPEYGLRATSGAQRTFGYMSQRDPDTDTATWVTPHTLPYSDDTGVRKGQPSAFKGLGASWIAVNDPYDGQPANAQEWYTRDFTTYSTFDFEYIDAADDHREVWLDGEQIGAKQDSNLQSYKFLGQYNGTLEAGRHKIAVQVGNSRLTKPNNPVAYIAAMRQLKADGNPVKGAPFLVTDDRWRASDDVSGMHWFEILTRLWGENADEDVTAFHRLVPGFTPTRDADGFGLADYGRHTLDVGQGLYDVMQQIAETGLNFDLDAGTFSVQGYKRLGDDRTATVELLNGEDGGNIMSTTPGRVEPRYNSATVQLQNGDWFTIEDADSISDYGRAKTGLSMGSTAWQSTAEQAADDMFAETAHPTRVFSSVTISTLTGPQLYRDFFIGDTILAPNEDGESVAVRVTAGGINATGETTTCELDLVEDRS